MFKFVLKKKSQFAFLCLFVFSLWNSFASSSSPDFSGIFNQNLGNSELDLLLEGKTLIRNTKTYNNAVINPSLSAFEQLDAEMKSLKPNYLAEIIQIIPVSSNPHLTSKMRTVLKDIPSYKGIPYYSEHNKIWVDLYSEAEIKNQYFLSDTEYIDADFIMDPFGLIRAAITLNSDDSSLFYVNSNTDSIKYENITCVKTNKMKSLIVVLKYNDYWILYGIGGINAPKIPFLSARIELSFMNRIKTFCNFVFDKIK